MKRNVLFLLILITFIATLNTSCTKDSNESNNSNGVRGCTDPNSFNYNPYATINDGSCIPKVYGCTDPNSSNYNSAANVNDGSCQYNSNPFFNLIYQGYTYNLDSYIVMYGEEDNWHILFGGNEASTMAIWINIGGNILSANRTYTLSQYGNTPYSNVCTIHAFVNQSTNYYSMNNVGTVTITNYIPNTIIAGSFSCYLSPTFSTGNSKLFQGTFNVDLFSKK